MRQSLLAMAIAMLVLTSLLPGRVAPQEEDGQAFDFDRYHDSWEIQAELDIISARYPSITQKLSLGQTWEGREITALRVTDNPAEEEADEPDILIMGAHHAYELPSAEVPLYILKFLVENYAANHTVRTLVDSRDIWFVPLVNPDGHEYALQQDLTWRKNRRPIDLDGNGVPEGIGTDLNRNYGHLWGLQGVSHDPTNPIYCGPYAFSENETLAIQWLAQNQSFDLSLSYHTYGRQVMYPWGNSIDASHPREDVLREIANDIAERTGYTPMEGKDLYYTTGDSDDWLYSDMATLPFTIELGSERIVPQAELEPLCQDNLDAALYAIGIAAEPEKALLPDWTFMVYMSADADIGLANEALVDINEMEAAGSTANVSIIVLHDGRGTGDSNLYRIQKDPGGFNTAIVSATVDDLGEVIDPATGEADMSEPGTLHDFTAWAQENYPAQKYLLSIWGHGDGVIDGFIPDKGARMGVGEIHTALAGLTLDIAGFDACSMGHFEVADELVGIADIMIGSEALEPLAGWDYQTTLGRLVLAPGTEPRTLACHIVTDYLAANQENYITQAALDIGVYRDMFLPLLNDFAAVSLDFAFADYGKIWPARNITDTFVLAQDAVDLYQFLGNLRNANISGPAKERVDKLFDVTDELIFASGSATAYPNARTMAVYFPLLSSTVYSDYYSLGFCANLWDEYLGGIRSPAPRPFIDAPNGMVADTTAGPYNVTGAITGYGGETVRVIYRLSGGTWQYLTAIIDHGAAAAPIPGQANGSVIEYYFHDTTNNITEPYEIKWGNTTYLSFTVSASCDLSIASLVIVPESGLTEGNATAFIVNCTNDGTEPVTANVTLILKSATGNLTAGWARITLGAGEWIEIQFNWTALAGSWTATASASQDAVFDADTANQEKTAWVNVSASGAGDADLLAEYRTVIIVLILVWVVTMAGVMLVVGRLRKRRRAFIRQSLDNARDFLKTAEEFGGDITESALMLAKAEAALAGNKLAECERLVSGARETAMNAVGGEGNAKTKN